MQQEQLNGYAALILRVSLGMLFIAHGMLKVFVFTIPGTVGYFESLGLPGFFAYLTIIAEIGGGAALIAGVYTRLVSVSVIPVLLGSIVFAHAGAGWVFSMKAAAGNIQHSGQWP
ncbi:MAG: DoxX family protein [Caenibius sp.]